MTMTHSTRPRRHASDERSHRLNVASPALLLIGLPIGPVLLAYLRPRAERPPDRAVSRRGHDRRPEHYEARGSAGVAPRGGQVRRSQRSTKLPSTMSTEQTAATLPKVRLGSRVSLTREGMHFRIVISLVPFC